MKKDKTKLVIAGAILLAALLPVSAQDVVVSDPDSIILTGSGDITINGVSVATDDDVTAVADALAIETSDRIAYNGLQNGWLLAEETERIAADDALQTQVDDTYTIAEVDTVVGGLQTQIDDNTSDIATILSGDADAEFDTVLVNETLTIQGEATDTAYDFTDDGAGVNPDIPDDLSGVMGLTPETTPVYTQLGNTNTSQTDVSNTGIIAEANGDLTLISSQGTEVQFEYIRAVRNDIYNFDQPMAGESAAVFNVGGYVDPDTGEFVELGMLDLAENWDPDLVGTDLEGQLILDPDLVLTEAQEALLVMETDIPGSGGNLQVGGNANVDGVLSVGDVADVEMAISNNSDGVMTNAGNIAANTTAIGENTTAIGNNAADILTNANAITAEETARMAADDQIVADYTAADSALSGRIDVNKDDIAAEIVARTDADAALQTAIDDEETARVAADDALDARVSDNEDTLDVHFGLVSQNISDIADNASDISSLQSAMSSARMDIDTNTRGIAMVAAMTHTTILPGMDNALDISLAYFEGETGISISYSRRINENTQINFAAASTSDFEESVVRGGIGWQW